MLILYTLLTAFITAGAANLSGDWSLTMNPDFKDNPNVVSQCVFRQSGTDLTVRCGTGSELAGSVKGRTVTWGFSPKNGEKYPAATMTGTVNEPGNRIKGTWHVSINGGDKHGAFSAVKQQNRRH
jgi:hypothetical protein